MAYAHLTVYCLAVIQELFLTAFISLGFSVQIDEESANVVIKGENGRIPNRKATINVQSAGTAARFMTVFLAVAGGDYTLQSSDR